MPQIEEAPPKLGRKATRLGSAEGEGARRERPRVLADLMTRITNLIQQALSEGAGRGEFEDDAAIATLHIATVTRGLAVLERAFG